jgi:isopentenyl phosphate kinase
MRPPPEPVAPLVVKLGGSIITRKRQAERIRPKILRRLAEEIASAPDVPMILLHGAGSFGHPGAKKFGLARAPDADSTPPQRSRGAAIVSGEVRRLHLTVLRELIQAGVSPWSIPVANLGRNYAGRLSTLNLAPFADALKRGVTPVAFGDVVPDDDWGWSILSADTIAVALADHLPLRRVLFVSDVPGILAATTGGKPKVHPEVTDLVIEGLRRTGSGPDVTGGIRGKAEAMRAIAGAGVDAGLISGLKDGELARALRGEFVYGSWAHARPRAAPGRGGNRP